MIKTTYVWREGLGMVDKATAPPPGGRGTHTFGLRIDLSGALNNAIRALNGEVRAFEDPDDEELVAGNRESAAAMLEGIRDHVLLVRDASAAEGRNLLGQFARLYMLHSRELD